MCSLCFPCPSCYAFIFFFQRTNILTLSLFFFCLLFHWFLFLLLIFLSHFIASIPLMKFSTYVHKWAILSTMSFTIFSIFILMFLCDNSNFYAISQYISIDYFYFNHALCIFLLFHVSYNFYCLLDILCKKIWRLNKSYLSHQNGNAFFSQDTNMGDYNLGYRGNLVCSLL